MWLGLDIDPYSHTYTHMKTTLELPGELLISAKAMAARRRTTLKALFTRALERELRGEMQPASGHLHFAVDASGWPVLKRENAPQTTVTDDVIRALRDEEGI